MTLLGRYFDRTVVPQARRILQEVFSHVSGNHQECCPLLRLRSEQHSFADMTSDYSEQLSSRHTNNKSILCEISQGAYLSLKLLGNCIQNHLMVGKH